MRDEGGKTAVEGTTNDYANFHADWFLELDRHEALLPLLQSVIVK